jgi:hypothetical protein
MQENFLVPTVEQIRQARKKRIVAYMLLAFGDESSDEQEQLVFAVCGLIGTQQEWDDLADVWNKRTGGIPFHPADCEAEPPRGPYKNMSKDERDKLYTDMINILTRTKLMGYGAVLDIKSYKEYFPDTVDNVPYHFCFSRTVQDFAAIGHISVPPQKVKFAFHRNQKTNASAEVLYDFMGLSSDWEDSIYLDEISFVPNDYVGIQAACVVTREAMKHAYNRYVGPVHRPVRESMKVLFNSHLYKFRWFNKEYFEKESMGIVDNFEIAKAEYLQWLKEKKIRADNIMNRNRFLKEKMTKVPNLIE